MAALYCQGTIHAADAFDAEEAATRLRKAMKGLGTDELQIIKVLSEHDNAQRNVIKKKYTALFGRDLVDDLDNELAGNFGKLCRYLLMPSRVFDAFCLRNAIKRPLPGTKEAHLIDVLVSRSNQDIEDIKKEYKKLYSSDLEEDLKGDTSGDFQRILVALLQGMRKEDQTVDDAAAKAEAIELYDAGERKIGTDESVFTKILANRSGPFLCKVFEQYKEYAEKDIEDSICSELSGDTQKTFLAIVQYIKNPLKFFATCLFDSMDGIGTDDERLMQLLVSHSEVDLLDICKEYKKEYKASLAKHIHGDTSGDYRRLLLRLVPADGDENKKDVQKLGGSKGRKD